MRRRSAENVPPIDPCLSQVMGPIDPKRKRSQSRTSPPGTSIAPTQSTLFQLLTPREKRAHFRDTQEIWLDLYNSLAITNKKNTPKIAAEEQFQAYGSLQFPPWRFTEAILELTPENYKQWIQNLKDILTEHEYENLLQENYIPTTSNDNKALASLRRIITKSITSEVTELLANPDIFQETPANIVKAITAAINQRSTRDYFSLTTEAMNLRKTGTIAEYIAKHMAIRRKQITAQAPGINDERITINYILPGLLHDERYSARATTMMVDAPPKTIAETQQRLEQYESILTQHISLSTPTTSQFIHRSSYRPGPSRQTRGRGRGRYGRQSSRNLRSTIEDINKKLDALQNTKPRRGGRGRSSAKQATTSIEQVPEELLQALHSLENQSDPTPQPECTYSLDSAAHPSIISHSTPDQPNLPSPIHTATAAPHTIQTTKRGTLTLITSNGHTLRIPTLINNNVQGNLLSVNFISARYRPVVFTPRHAYIFSRTIPIKLLGIAKWNKHSYELQLQSQSSIAKPISATSETYLSLPKPVSTTLIPPPLETSRKHKPKSTKNARGHPRAVLRPLPLSSRADTPSAISQHANFTKWPNSLHKWHLIFNHAPASRLAHMASMGIIPDRTLSTQAKAPIRCSV